MGDFKIVQFQKKATLKLNPREAREFHTFLIKYKGAMEDKTGFKREKQIRAIRMTLNDKNRSLHIRQTRSGKKINIFAHTEKNPRKKPIGHGLDALRKEDEHFGTGSNLVRKEFKEFKQFKRNEKAKKRRIEMKRKRNCYRKRAKQGWRTRRKKYGRKGHR